MTGCFLERLKEPRLAFNDDCLGEEGAGGSDDLGDLRVASLKCFEVDCAEGKGEGVVGGAGPR